MIDCPGDPSLHHAGGFELVFLLEAVDHLASSWTEDDVLLNPRLPGRELWTLICSPSRSRIIFMFDVVSITRSVSFSDWHIVIRSALARLTLAFNLPVSLLKASIRSSKLLSSIIVVCLILSIPLLLRLG
jgi:hypothetical protein